MPRSIKYDIWDIWCVNGLYDHLPHNLVALFWWKNHPCNSFMFGHKLTPFGIIIDLGLTIHNGHLQGCYNVGSSMRSRACSKIANHIIITIKIEKLCLQIIIIKYFQYIWIVKWQDHTINAISKIEYDTSEISVC
jgi:hypothetical protein